MVAVVAFSPLGWRCPIAATLHVPCPTCGMTRALDLAFRGHLHAATAMHPLVWIVVPAVALLLGIEVAGYLRTGTWGASSRVRGATATLVVVAVLVFSVWMARFFGAFGGPVPV